ncbi:MAG TPA: hypothetical protein VGM70_02055 [Pseudolysinimonas sp.]|jgi:hypothetical protein
MTDHTYQVDVTLTVQVTNPAAARSIAALSGSATGDERADVQAAIAAGLKELPQMVERYGFRVLAAKGRATGS